jgi:Hemerythrin HHE cation binding domain
VVESNTGKPFVKVISRQLHSTNHPKCKFATKPFVALENHAQVEELVFYPSVEEETDDEGETLVEEARQEHQTVKELIAELRALDDEDAFETKFHELQQAVEHHVAEEATAMLPLAEAAREEEREDLGEQMREVKQQQSW